MQSNKIIIRGAREHNLKNVDVEIPRDKLIVMTGLSGSGKSSLAFDTIFADGQRRYMESLSSYARQFLGQMEKPDVDSIEGLSPAISIDQKTTSKNPRSTVGTVTEIYDYLRLLYARIGVPHCPVCGREINQQSVDQIVDSIMELPERTKILLLAPIVKGRKGEHKRELENARKQGFVRVRIDGEDYELTDDIKLDKNKKHLIEIVVDRLIIKEGIKSRLTDSIELITSLTEGMVVIDVQGGEKMVFSTSYACPEHGISLPELQPRMFSFNNPFGACPTCTGLGVFKKVDPEIIIPDKNLSIREGAIKANGWNSLGEDSVAMSYFNAISEKYGISLDVPVKKLTKEQLDIFLYGTGSEKLELRRGVGWFGDLYNTSFEGVINNLERRYNRENATDSTKSEIEAYMSEHPCPDCKGRRLNRESLSVTVGGLNIYELTELSVTDALAFFDGLKLSKRDSIIGARIIKEIRERLGFLNSVGLEYLTLARSSGTLSGGESQRIRLATQIGSSLMGVLYILDEPSIGLHQRDNDKLIATLKRLRDLGNTLIVVEHDEDTMRASDFIVDVGPGAGVHGGEIVCTGTVDEIMKCERSWTGRYLSGALKIPVPEKRREGNGEYLRVFGACENNLKNIDVEIPLGVFTCVTGVSGSGKSSLVNEIISKHLSAQLNRARTRAGKFDRIEGIEHLDKVIHIDQSPIGRTPRSNPATYTGVFADIRELFASTSDAKAHGYGAGRFSFNVKGGRCEACEGDGILKIEMHFLPDVYVPCEVCRGKRYNRETLEVRYKGKNIYDVLEMTVEEGAKFFENIPKIKRRMDTLVEVGLGYVKIGQPATTLSGGEAQRVKLATELSKRATGRTFYILDEPTTGLHSADVHKLIEVLQKLADTGNTVLVIEHNLDVIKSADHIIDLGPEGGSGGGTVICTGTPEEVAECAESYTGHYLKKMLTNK
ncbi:excinuclease ABC subunit A [Ruminococcus sp. YE71]|uniref:excinuclease ABC subunit UvrA n=1 Tax=unclassified Ruminococcus TaxID=2608920 RepID=UPI000883578F|nr:MULTISPECIES: excinuclease ABC subunit UvrA [unclassified Ruminococcus]SDA17634.1 excinuclease ABC subunit A [Ruminococcus sp. YE78]SFW27135.1 excinuclease ABC subunit A [Ruminococcus sp. YE71]